MRRSALRYLRAALLLIVVCPSTAGAYSVLAHEAVIDSAWDRQILPFLKARFPRTTPDSLRAARAYAYGGSLIQDLGYYPFGSKFFSNLVHYVRSGAFVESLIRESRDVNELAFALGALAHFASDNVGHPSAVNRAVPILYPKLQSKYGSAVLYAQSPSRHVMAEFAFDVVQVARGTFKADAYQDLVGFQVATGVLERAFHVTYGLGLNDVFGDVDMAIGTYRHAASEIIPDITRMAWRDKRDEILAANPTLTEQDFVFTLTQQQYEQTFGRTYRKPSLMARVVVAIFKVLPKFGPFKPLAFEPLTPETERMFLESFAATRDRYRASLRALQNGQLALRELDLDTGHPSARGANPLADETYRVLLDELADRKFANVPAALRRCINEHYEAGSVPKDASRKVRKQEHKAAQQLAALNAVAVKAR